jgi:hypothetical protein
MLGYHWPSALEETVLPFFCGLFNHIRSRGHGFAGCGELSVCYSERSLRSEESGFSLASGEKQIPHVARDDNRLWFFRSLSGHAVAARPITRLHPRRPSFVSSHTNSVGATRRANLQPVSVRFSSQSGGKHVPREAREQKPRHRMDSLNGRRVIPGDGELPAEINAEHSARQQIEHEPKGRQPIRRLKIEIQQQPAQTTKDLRPPHPPPHQIAQLGSVVGPHPRHQPTPFEFRSAQHALPNATRSAESPYVQASPPKRAARLYHNQPPRKLAERSNSTQYLL